MTRLTRKEMKTIVLEEMNTYLSELAPTSSLDEEEVVEPEGTPQVEPQAEPAAQKSSKGITSTEAKRGFLELAKMLPAMMPEEREWLLNTLTTNVNLAAKSNALQGAHTASDKLAHSRKQKALGTKE